MVRMIAEEEERDTEGHRGARSYTEEEESDAEKRRGAPRDAEEEWRSRSPGCQPVVARRGRRCRRFCHCRRLIYEVVDR